MNLDAQLTQLENAQLVHRADNAELAYQFKHALTQDAAYVMLLKRDRARVGQQIVLLETVEQRSPQLARSQPEL